MRHKPFAFALALLLLLCLAGPALALKPAPGHNPGQGAGPQSGHGPGHKSGHAPGFLPEAAVTSVSWEEADKACKARGAYLPTAWQLQDLAGGSGGGAYAGYGWPAKAFWTRESLADGRGGRQFYAVAMETGHMDLFENERLNAYVCAKGAGMDRKAKAISGAISVIAPVTMNWEDAGRYCQARGKKLPSIETLKSVADKSGSGAYAAHHWPRGLYWSSDFGANQPMLVNIDMGEAMAFPRDSLQWTVCAEQEQ